MSAKIALERGNGRKREREKRRKERERKRERVKYRHLSVRRKLIGSQMKYEKEIYEFFTLNRLKYLCSPSHSLPLSDLPFSLSLASLSLTPLSHTQKQTHSSLPIPQTLSLSLLLKIICYSDRSISYIFFIDVGSIPHQNLHNNSFSTESSKV
jgi:hypothetical protein